MLTGYKTYMLSFLGVLDVFAMGLGYVNAAVGLMILGFLGFGSIAALRSAIKAEILGLIKSANLPLPPQ